MLVAPPGPWPANLINQGDEMSFIMPGGAASASAHAATGVTR